MRGWSTVMATFSSTLLVLAPITARGQDPVPVQRPGSIAAPAPAPETPPPADAAPTPAPPVAETPAEPPATEPAPTEPAPTEPESAPAPEPVPAEPMPDGGRIEGLVSGATSKDYLVDAVIELRCACLSEPRRTRTDYDGRFAIDGLPAGQYTLTVDHGAGPTRAVVTLDPGASERLSLRVAEPMAQDERDRREREITRGQTMIAIGSVAAMGGLFMIMGAGVEAAKPDCKFGLDDCSNAPRPAVARGLGIGGAVLVAGGSTLLGFGIHTLRRARAGFVVDGQTAGIVIRGKF